ncbi:MAG: NAD-dependent epimerase/dehydratase family protein [Methanomassiliicoccales archaeon]
MELGDRRIMVTGAAGFIGSHLVDRLLERGNQVVGVDNLSAGRRDFLGGALSDNRFQLVEGDLLSLPLGRMMGEVDVLCHFAANPDVRIGASDTRTHFDQNIEATYRLLEACREGGVDQVIFPSTSTVYGEPDEIPTPESYGPLKPISVYGASKLACEAMISAYCHTFDMEAVIYRFANVVGPRSTHNVLHDFVRKLREDPAELEILGAEPGTSKSYVHVSDCVDAMVTGAENAHDPVEIFNIGSEDRTCVREIADIVVEEMCLESVRYRWTGGVKEGRGWLGDVRVMLLSIDRLRGYGWAPRYGSSQAIRRAVREILS